MTERGRFITLEGGEGVGKSTNHAVIAEFLRARGIEVVETREPGGTPLAEELRELLLTPREEAVNETAELLMMFAARAQHIQEVIEPALCRGAWVLCDRFTDATFAYQGAGRGLDKTLILSLESKVQNGLQPDLTVLLDLDPEVGMARARARGETDRIEKEEMTFFHRIREGYLERQAANSQRFLVIDAAATMPEVKCAIEEGIAKFFGWACND